MVVIQTMEIITGIKDSKITMEIFVEIMEIQEKIMIMKMLDQTMTILVMATLEMMVTLQMMET